MLDTQLEIEETMDNIMWDINKGKVVNVTVSKDWSLKGDLMAAFNSL